MSSFAVKDGGNNEALEHYAKKAMGSTFKHVAMVKGGSPLYYVKKGSSKFYAFKGVAGLGEQVWKISVRICILLQI